VTRTSTRSRPKRKSLSGFISERFDEFSRSQKDVARYIVDHLDEAAFLTAEELARRASTSSSTVVRFSQALGFDGYPELQQAAIEEYRNATGEGQYVDIAMLDAVVAMTDIVTNFWSMGMRGGNLGPLLMHGFRAAAGVPDPDPDASA